MQHVDLTGVIRGDISREVDQHHGQNATQRVLRSSTSFSDALKTDLMMPRIYLFHLSVRNALGILSQQVKDPLLPSTVNYNAASKVLTGRVKFVTVSGAV
jgi:hypothetical protein